jgi:hypothetical protein
MLSIGADGNRLKSCSVMSRGWTWLYLAATAVYFYLALFLPPSTPLFHSSDGSIYLNDARRMLDGETPYRDFFQFAPPGLDLLYYGLFKLFGVRLWLPNIVMVLVAVTFAWLGVVVSRRVMSPGLAFLPGLLFAVALSEWVWSPTHHWFSVLAIMGAMALLLDRRTTPRILLAGLLCGIATCFTQNRGLVALLGFAIFLGWESQNLGEEWQSFVKKQLLVVSGFLAAVVIVNAYYVEQAGWDRFIFCTFTFVIRHYPTVRGNTFWNVFDQIPLHSQWYGLRYFLVWAMVNSVVPFIAPLFLLRYAKPSQPRPAAWEQLVLIASTSLACTLAVAPSPSFSRLTAGGLPALVLLVWHLDGPARWCRILRRAVWACVLIAVPRRTIWTGAQIAAAAALGWQVPWTGSVLDTASGRLAFPGEPSTYLAYKWIQEQTCPGDYFFDLHWVDRYWFLGLRNPTSTPLFTPTDYTTPGRSRTRLLASNGDLRDPLCGTQRLLQSISPVRLLITSIHFASFSTPITASAGHSQTANNSGRESIPAKAKGPRPAPR